MVTYTSASWALTHDDRYSLRQILGLKLDLGEIYRTPSELGKVEHSLCVPLDSPSILTVSSFSLSPWTTFKPPTFSLYELLPTSYKKNHSAFINENSKGVQFPLINHLNLKLCLNKMSHSKRISPSSTIYNSLCFHLPPTSRLLETTYQPPTLSLAMLFAFSPLSTVKLAIR